MLPNKQRTCCNLLVLDTWFRTLKMVFVTRGAGKAILSLNLQRFCWKWTVCHFQKYIQVWPCLDSGHLGSDSCSQPTWLHTGEHSMLWRSSPCFQKVMILITTGTCSAIWSRGQSTCPTRKTGLSRLQKRNLRGDMTAAFQYLNWAMTGCANLLSNPFSWDSLLS